jgi:hypothetical protein
VKAVRAGATPVVPKQPKEGHGIVTRTPKSLKIKVKEYDDVTAAIELPVLPPEMDGEHDIIFKTGDRVIFGLFIHRYADGRTGVELLPPDVPEPVAEHEFKAE